MTISLTRIQSYNGMGKNDFEVKTHHPHSYEITIQVTCIYDCCSVLWSYDHEIPKGKAGKESSICLWLYESVNDHEICLTTAVKMFIKIGFSLMTISLSNWNSNPNCDQGHTVTYKRRLLYDSARNNKQIIPLFGTLPPNIKVWRYGIVYNK